MSVLKEMALIVDRLRVCKDISLIAGVWVGLCSRCLGDPVRTNVSLLLLLLLPLVWSTVLVITLLL